MIWIARLGFLALLGVLFFFLFGGLGLKEAYWQEKNRKAEQEKVRQELQDWWKKQTPEALGGKAGEVAGKTIEGGKRFKKEVKKVYKAVTEPQTAPQAPTTVVHEARVEVKDVTPKPGPVKPEQIQPPPQPIPTEAPTELPKETDWGPWIWVGILVIFLIGVGVVVWMANRHVEEEDREEEDAEEEDTDLTQ